MKTLSSGSPGGSAWALAALLGAAAILGAAEVPVPGIPAEAAAVLVAMDEANARRDADAVAALFDDAFVSMPLGSGKAFVRWVTARMFERGGDAPLKSVLLGGARVGDMVVASVDHLLLAEPGKEVTIHKLYFLGRRGAGYRILATAEGAAGDRWELAPEEMEVPFAGLRLRPPQGWFLVENSRGMFLEEKLLVSPSFDVWMTLGLSDAGARDLEPFGRRETEISLSVFRGMEVQEEARTTVAGLPAWRVRYRRGVPAAPGGDPPVERERLYIVRGEIGFVASYARTSRAVEAKSAVLDSLFSGLTAPPLPEDALKQFLAAHGRGRVEGKRYENDTPEVSFKIPSGWSCRPRGSSLPYLAGLVEPDGKREILAGAVPLFGDAEKAVGRLAWMGSREPPVLEKVRVAGLPGWRCRRTTGAGDYLTVYVPAGGVLHFFSLEPAGEDGKAVLDRFLAGVRLPGEPRSRVLE